VHAQSSLAEFQIGHVEGGECEAGAGIALPESVAARWNALAGIGPQWSRTACEISRHIGRILDGNGFGHGAHDAP
jgi:hypothetical protein